MTLAISTLASWALVLSLWFIIGLGVGITFGRAVRRAEDASREARSEARKRWAAYIAGAGR